MHHPRGRGIARLTHVGVDAIVRRSCRETYPFVVQVEPDIRIVSRMNPETDPFVIKVKDVAEIILGFDANRAEFA